LEGGASAAKRGAVSLTGKQRRFLRSLGHGLVPVVLLGKHGITDALVAATDEAITTHELIKVKRSADCPATRKEVAEALAAALKAEVIQQIGHVVLLYRKHPKKPVIELPR
jgi:RNA-binding protein